MAKPFAMPELAARVRALVRRSQAQTGPKIVHGPLTLDTVARRAQLNGTPLDLSAREWAVLEVLLARVEKIVSKEAIIQAVASWGEELTPNAIEVYVSRLRANLDPASVQIRTVRGFGYMLEEFKEKKLVSSLRVRLLKALLPPVATLLVAGAVGAYFLSLEPASDAYDQALVDVGIALGERIRSTGDQVSFDLPGAAEQVLRTDSTTPFLPRAARGRLGARRRSRTAAGPLGPGTRGWRDRL